MKKTITKKAITKKTISRFTALLIVCLLLVPNILALSVSAASISDNIDDILFDSDYYYQNNPDVVKVYGKTASALYSHYLEWGKSEGRRPSDLFDATYYVNRYPDLKAAFGNDYVALYNHFVNYGIREGRIGSADFNINVYKANYADLRAAFGTDASNNWKYYKHYRQYGKSEHRNAVSSISGSSTTSSTSSTTSTTSSTTTAYVKTSGLNLNLRSTASTSGKILAKLANGTQVTVISTSNGWCKVRVNNTEGFVSSKYLSYSTPSSISSRQQKMADTALSYLGNTNYNGYCQKFVRVVGEAIGLSSGNASSALDACSKWRVSTSQDNIPVGATIYLRSKNTTSAGYRYGHVGIYVGDGYVVHALSTVRKTSLTELLNNYTYLGWGWQAGVDLR